MINNQNVRETAIEIYKNGYRGRSYPKEAPQSKLFFLKLRSAVVKELETTGFCELADYIIDAKRGKLDIIVYSVFADIAFGYEKHTLTDVENDSKYYEFIPYIQGRRGPFGAISWSECACIDEHCITLSAGTIEKIRKARQVVRMKHIELVKKSMCDCNNDSSVSLLDVQKKADRIIEDAKREADRIINDSRIEVERINESAKVSANTIIDEANSIAKAKAEESAEKLIEKYLLAEQKRYKSELNEELSRYTSEHLECSKRVATTHMEMCDATNALQVKWIRTLDDALSQMAAVKAEFYSHIHDWQVSLFPSEIKPIAERYLELYRIVNVDKLLREAILFKNSVDDEVIQTENVDGTENVVTVNEKVPDTIILGLQRLNKTLTTFLRRFEVALNGLDLYVYYPNVGDEFDDMWHIPDDESEEYYGKRIKECVVPGIAKKANDDCGDDVLIPAVVKVEMES